MELSDRKKKILQLVVSDYIETAVPVSSKSLTEKHLTNLSSATVRSELAALEELGYLSQPHTSAGRVPSIDAYKLYVSDLMVKDNLSVNELEYIKKIFLENTNDVEQVIKQTAKVISELTSLTSLAVTSHDESEKINNIKLFRFKPDGALLIIVTDTKLLKDSVIELSQDMSDDRIDEANVLLERMFVGKTFKDICNYNYNLDESFENYKSVFLKVIDALKDYVTTTDDVILEGQDKILQHPEYADLEKLKKFMSVVTKKDKVINLLSNDGRDIKINVKIGTEGYEEMPSDCSVVSATYSVGGVKLGTYGVIGPVRMDYGKVVAVLENVGKILENILSNR
ncbi:MAG: heat-inducible transcription repressor HrcA [Clostridia bacterium]|nr:heat-inducible transcription repressor HrcA [Clostridia bacterium]